MGTRLDAVRSIMMTSTANTMAATGALNIAANEPAAAQPINKSLRRKCFLVWDATSDPTAAPACIAGASNPPEPPNPTDKMLVTTGANIHVRFMRPRLVEIACNVDGMPGPGCSPLSNFRTTQCVAHSPKMGPKAKNQDPPSHDCTANIPCLNPPTACFMNTAIKPAPMPTNTAQSINPRSDFIHAQASARRCANRDPKLAFTAPSRSRPTHRPPAPRLLSTR